MKTWQISVLIREIFAQNAMKTLLLLPFYLLAALVETLITGRIEERELMGIETKEDSENEKGK